MRTRADAILDYYTPRPDELEAYDRAYARLDAISGVIGVKPTRPTPGEMPSQYRRRLLREVLPHSAKYRQMNISGLGGDALDFAEDLIYADAVQTAKAGTDVPSGQMRALTHRDAVGRLVITWAGNDYMAGIWDNFVSPGATVFYEEASIVSDYDAFNLHQLEELRDRYAVRKDWQKVEQVRSAINKLGEVQTNELAHCGRLFKHRHYDPETGRVWHTWTGDNAAWMSHFQSPPMTVRVDTNLFTGKNSEAGKALAAKRAAALEAAGLK